MTARAQRGYSLVELLVVLALMGMIAVAMASGKPVSATAETDNGQVKVPSILVDVIAVDRQNLDDTVVKDGFHPAAALKPAER